MRPSPKALSDRSTPRSEGEAFPAPNPAGVGSIAATSTGEGWGDEKMLCLLRAVISNPACKEGRLGWSSCSPRWDKLGLNY